MNSGKKIQVKNLLLPMVFVVFLVLTIVFRGQAYGRDKEMLGTDVSVEVVEVRTNSAGLNPGGVDVTVSYQGEEYKLHGVPSGARFEMENSKNYHSSVSAKLYNDKLYYDAASINLVSDKLYYACLAVTFVSFIILFARWRGIL